MSQSSTAVKRRNDGSPVSAVLDDLSIQPDLAVIQEGKPAVDPNSEKPCETKRFKASPVKKDEEERMDECEDLWEADDSQLFNDETVIKLVCGSHPPPEPMDVDELDVIHWTEGYTQAFLGLQSPDYKSNYHHASEV